MRGLDSDRGTRVGEVLIANHYVAQHLNVRVYIDLHTHPQSTPTSGLQVSLSCCGGSKPGGGGALAWACFNGGVCRVGYHIDVCYV